ncbi:MAG: Fpg/Nei family DNA glycosylase, partial [Microbacteriaceae bacterium]|nr:Fpg/Nei family DNA glycosylase [Microbacteriaceae bacterium]
YDEVPTSVVKPNGYINLRLRLDDGSGFDVTEAGTKHALALHVVRRLEDVPGIARLGPDALSLDLAAFAALLAGQGGRIKNVLTDQSVIAGVGNAYSDEVLHRAKMSPYAIAKRISPHDTVDLYEAMQSTLRKAIEEASGRPPADLKDAKRSGMRVHGRDGQPCPVCGDAVRSVKFADRSFQYCSTCQTDGRPLADRVLSRLVK